MTMSEASLIYDRGLLTIRTLIAKLTGIVFAIGAGIIAGKEGPFVHGGGIVGGGIGGAGSMWVIVPQTLRKIRMSSVDPTLQDIGVVRSSWLCGFLSGSF